MDTEDTLEKCFDNRSPWEENAFNMGECLLRTNRLYAASTKDYEPIWWYVEPVIGIYQDDFTDIIEHEVKRVAGIYGRKHLCKEIVYHVRTQAYRRGVELGGPPDKIVVRNGVLDLNTKEMSPFNPDEYYITALPVKYDPEAKCPNFNAFHATVVPKANDQRANEEFLGYCLVGDYRYANMMLFVGSGRNGKSTLLEVFTAFLGKQNVVGETLQNLAHRPFARARLFGKLANICADIPSTPIEYTGVIKMLTGGDIVPAEVKFKPSFDFQNRAKLLFSANEVPTARDSSDAFHSRVRIIDFPMRFDDGAPGTINRRDLVESLTTETELSGLLNLALDGWQRYNMNGILTGSQTIEQKRQDYTMRSNPIEHYCETYLSQSTSDIDDVTRSEFVEHQLLYSSYCKMCLRMGRKPTSSNWFSEKLVQYSPYASKGKHPDQDKRTTVWFGIRFDEVQFKRDQGEIL